MSVKDFGAAAAGKTWHCTTFTAVGANTWTKNPNSADEIIVDLVGGGQAGVNSIFTMGGAGGASGQRVVQVINVNGVPSATVTIGAGGAAAGAHGGDSTFGTLLRAMGSGRATPYISQAGAFAFVGLDDSLSGQLGNSPGVSGFYHPGCASASPAVGGTNGTNNGGGAGAGTFYGQGGNGGNGGSTTGGNGAAATGYGSGGGGGGGGSTTSGNGGAGAQGIGKVWEYW